MKKKVNIIVGICSWMGALEKREAVRNTWLRHPAKGIECLFFIGGKRVPAGEKKDMVVLDVPDGYNELPAKVMAFFRYALDHYDFEWLFKCDDDTYLDLTRLASVADSDYDLIGDALVVIRQSPSGGAGYFLKRSMVERLVAQKDFPPTGPEDLLVGEWVSKLGGKLKSTSALYMNNVYYPDAGNEMATAHWCSPKILHTIYEFNHVPPASIYDGEHPHWKDELYFYADGAFRRKNASCYGWWSIGAEGVVTLQWLTWAPEQLIGREGSYIGSQTSLHPRASYPSLEQLSDVDISRTTPGRYIHLGYGNRRLAGWLNLGPPNYDIVRPLPWENGSVDAYYLDNGIDEISSIDACRFFREAFRSLKVGGVLRLTFRDVLSLLDEVTPAFRQYMKDKVKGKGIPPGDVGTIMEVFQQKSLWTTELLTALLESIGFEVTRFASGVSRNGHLRELERRVDQDECPFDLLGIVCLEALKKQESKGRKIGILKRRTRNNSNSSAYVTNRFMQDSRTGNHMFQIAAVYAHALRHGLECRIPWNALKESRELHEYLGESASACPEGGYADPVVYREACFSYRPIPDTILKGAIEGYFQSEQYFRDFDGEIRSLFGNLAASRQDGVAGVHIRLGDYQERTDMYHSPDTAFLNEALGRLSDNIRELVIFSDDPAQAMEMVKRVDAAQQFELAADSHHTLDALRIMSSMQELVLSCSSFSWWGAWLGNQDKVLIQKEWFAGKIRDYQDVYREKWLKL